jgi:hypothetical protein
MSRTSKNTPRRDVVLVSLVIAGVAAAGVTASCSSSFSSCDATKTCALASGGIAGTIDAGGAGGGLRSAMPPLQVTPSVVRAARLAPLRNLSVRETLIAATR